MTRLRKVLLAAALAATAFAFGLTTGSAGVSASASASCVTPQAQAYLNWISEARFRPDIQAASSIGAIWGEFIKERGCWSDYLAWSTQPNRPDFVGHPSSDLYGEYILERGLGPLWIHPVFDRKPA